MNLHCTATSETRCPIWKNGEVQSSCFKYACKHLSNVYAPIKCKCGATPKIWGEGIGKQYVLGKDMFDDIFWAEFDGYRVGCLECGFETSIHGSPEQAINSWNMSCKT